MGFLVIGVNPRRHFDKDYEAFVSLLNRQLATSLASVTLFEEEIRRGNTAAEAAALERSRLSEELALSASRLTRMAELSPVGMFSMAADGLILEANDRWFEITGHPREMNAMSWMNCLKDSSLSDMEIGWQRLTEKQLPWSGELQLKKPWFDPVSGEESDHWVCVSVLPI